MQMQSTFEKTQKPNRMHSEGHTKALSRKESKRALKASRKIATANKAAQNDYFNDCLMGSDDD